MGQGQLARLSRIASKGCRRRESFVSCSSTLHFNIEIPSLQCLHCSTSCWRHSVYPLRPEHRSLSPRFSSLSVSRDTRFVWRPSKCFKSMYNALPQAVSFLPCSRGRLLTKSSVNKDSEFSPAHHRLTVIPYVTPEPSYSLVSLCSTGVGLFVDMGHDEAWIGLTSQIDDILQADPSAHRCHHYRLLVSNAPLSGARLWISIDDVATR